MWWRTRRDPPGTRTKFARVGFDEPTVFAGWPCCAAMAAMKHAIWPLMSLEVSTPILTLHYITDDLGAELAQLAAEGVHDPAAMPFSTPWTDAPSPELKPNTLRFYWRNRADTTVEHWDLNLAVIVDGAVVGMCSVEADMFATRRSAETGSWLGRRHQRQGIRREMRHAFAKTVVAQTAACFAHSFAKTPNWSAFSLVTSSQSIDCFSGCAGRAGLDELVGLLDRHLRDERRGLQHGGLHLAGLDRGDRVGAAVEADDLDLAVSPAAFSAAMAPSAIVSLPAMTPLMSGCAAGWSPSS